MEYEQAAILLRSDDTTKQLSALKSVSPILNSLPPSDEFLSALIEHGLSCEKSHFVRQISFQCVEVLYSIRITRWIDVRAAISTEFGTAESAECLVAAIRVLNHLPITDLVALIGSKDIMSVMKGCFQAENVSICAAACEGMGPLLIDTWLYVQSTSSIEGIIPVESTAEARRYRDDLCDFIGELFKNFAHGIVGKAPSSELDQNLPDHSRSVGAYFSVIADLMERYFSCYDQLHRWTASVLGATLPEPPPSGDADLTSRSASLSLLMKEVLPTLLADPYLLFSRWHKMTFHVGAMSCISHTMLALLLAIPSDSGVNGFASRLVFEEQVTMQFTTTQSTDETEASRAKQMEIRIVRVAEEWLVLHLVPALRSVVPVEVSTAVYCCLSMMQSPFMVHKREQVYLHVLEHAHRIMLQGSLAMPSHTITGYSDALFADYHQLIPWAIYSCRFVPREVAGGYLPALLELVCTHISDDTSRSKLFAEIAALLLIDIEESGAVAHPEVLSSVMSHPYVVSALQIDPTQQQGQQQQSFLRERLMLALCRSVCKLLPVTIAYLLAAVKECGGISTTILQATAVSNTIAEEVDAFGAAPALLAPQTFGDDKFATSNTEGASPMKIPLPRRGVGRYVVFGTQEGKAGEDSSAQRSKGDAESIEQAVTQLDNLIASALFILRSCHKCLGWSAVGNASDALQLSYVELVSALADIIAPMHRLVNGKPDLRTPPFIQQATEWAKDTFVDIVSADLNLLENQDKTKSVFPTQNVRMKFLCILSQHAGVMFADPANKVKTISSLLRTVLLRSNERDRYTSVLSNRAAKGYLGGAVSAHPPHPFLSAPLQQDALALLELLAKHQNTIAAEHVLFILYECEALCIAEGTRNHHIICPSLDERLSLAIRRVKLCCPDGKGAAVKRPQTFQMDTLSPQTLQEEEKKKKAKMLSERKISGAFSTYDNSMSDAFTPSKGGRRRGSGTAADDAHPDHHIAAHDIFDSVWRVSVSTEAVSLPTDVEAEYGMFCGEAITSDGMSRSHSSVGGKVRHVCAMDVIAVVDDVLDAHLSVPTASSRVPKNAPAELCGASAVMGRTYEVRECRQWVQLNGSFDLFTVLGAINYCDPVTGNIEVSFRIINSAGFKVPLFSLQLLLGAYAQQGDMDTKSGLTFDTVGQTSRGNVADGVEYFLPGATVERTFNFRVQQFMSAFVVLRVVYPELMPEMDSVEVFSLPMTPSASTQQSGEDGPSDAAETKKKFKEYEIPRVATFDCIPLAIPSSLLLTPYGAGALSSMMEFTNQGSRGEYWNAADFHGGIPKSVYQCLHARARYSSRFQVLSVPRVRAHGLADAQSLADEVTIAIHRIGQLQSAGDLSPSAPSWWWDKGQNWSLGMASRVRLGQAASTSVGSLASVLCWCLQDWWGREICVTLTASKMSCNGYSRDESDTLKHVYWSGFLDIQCSDELVLSTLSNDVNNLLHAITGGLMRVNTQDSEALSKSRDGGDMTFLMPHSTDMSPGVHSDGLMTPVSVVTLQARTESVANRRRVATISTRNFMLENILADHPPPVVDAGGAVSFL